MSSDTSDFLKSMGIVELDAVVEHPKLLVFGKPRAGKTTLGCSDDDVLVINCEQEGVIAGKRSKTLGRNVVQKRVNTWPDFVKIVEGLQELVRQGKPIPFKWLFIDTLTTLQDRILMRHILNEVHAAKSSRSLYIPDKPEYLRNQLMLVDYVKQLNDLPVNILYSAHIMLKKDPEGNEFYYPQIQGGDFKVAQQILAMMTSYGFLHIEQRTNDKGQKLISKSTGLPLKDRVIQWEDEGYMQGGDRLNVFGAQTRNRTLKQLREMWEAVDQNQSVKE